VVGNGDQATKRKEGGKQQYTTGKGKRIAHAAPKGGKIERIRPNISNRPKHEFGAKKDSCALEKDKILEKEKMTGICRLEKKNKHDLMSQYLEETKAEADQSWQKKKGGSTNALALYTPPLLRV